MVDLHPRYLLDEAGNVVAVQLEVAEFARLLEEYRDLAAQLQDPTRDPTEPIRHLQELADLAREQAHEAPSSEPEDPMEELKKLGLL